MNNDGGRNKVLILGAKGMLGGALKKVFPHAYAWGRNDCDVTNTDALKNKIQELKNQPEAIVNCVAFNDVDGAEEKRGLAFQINAEVPGQLAKIANEFGIPLVHFSTNYVFDGQAEEYQEHDKTHPLSSYGESKLAGEQAVVNTAEKFYVIRTAVLFGPQGESELSKKSFVDIMLELSAKTDTVKAVEDEVNSITYVKDLAERVKLLLEGGHPFGIYHITNTGQASWYNVAKEIFAITRKQIHVVPVPSTAFPRKAARPKRAVLQNTKLAPMRPWQEALQEFLLNNK